ncbi:GNAT family N-acetyltransferase [Lacrimispora sp.]|uniref:GNAT family N-acetyltransferase n=1 Tax=Lacrimispora sp. TaxID=2719234 RepID=UPI003FA5A504
MRFTSTVYWANDEEVIKFLTWSPIMSAEEAERILSDWIHRYSNNKFYQWAIVLKDNCDEPIGTISVKYTLQIILYFIH